MPSGRSSNSDAWIESLEAIMLGGDDSLNYPPYVIPLNEYIIGTLNIFTCHITTRERELIKNLFFFQVIIALGFNFSFMFLIVTIPIQRAKFIILGYL